MFAEPTAKRCAIFTAGPIQACEVATATHLRMSVGAHACDGRTERRLVTPVVGFHAQAFKFASSAGVERKPTPEAALTMTSCPPRPSAGLLLPCSLLLQGILRSFSCSVDDSPRIVLGCRIGTFPW